MVMIGNKLSVDEQMSGFQNEGRKDPTGLTQDQGLAKRNRSANLQSFILREHVSESATVITNISRSIINSDHFHDA